MAFIRLPAAGVIHTTLQNAQILPLTPVARKARSDLLKSIGWSYASLSAPEKAAAAQAYVIAGYANLPGTVVQLNAGHAPPDAAIEAMAQAITDAGGHGAHTGAAQRYRGMLPNEDMLFTVSLAQFRTHLDQINAGTYDLILDEVFPNPKDYWGLAQKNTRRQVRNTFQYAYDIVAAWNVHANRNQLIRIDTYLDPQGAAATSSQRGLLFSASYFNRPAGDQVSTLVHEATHAIQNNSYVTFDNGGYIGELRWFDANLDLRQLNASHYEFVIQRIQGRAPLLRPAAGNAADGAGGAESQAATILCKAWICALNQYSGLYHYAHKANPTADDQQRIKAIGKMLGLSVGKTANGQRPAVTDQDLAGAETRVVRLGMLYGGGGTVHLAVQAAVQAAVDPHAPLALTVDEILLRVIQMGGGPIRKSGNSAKTVEMIKTLAYLCHQNLRPGGPTEDQQWARVAQFNAMNFPNGGG